VKASGEERTLPRIRIRPAVADDVVAARALLDEAGLPPDGLEDQFGEAYAVAEADGCIVGLAGIEIHGRSGLLRSAAVAPPWRGTGIGDALTRDRIAWARAMGLEGIYLLTTTAGAYFPRFGFSPAVRDDAPPAIRASREFADACPETAVCMYLALDAET
jgi:N-acetylglutamate synthase-like GNAT family acetyltransferase